jgi:hypothetical protein
MRTPRKTSLASHLGRFVFGVIFVDDTNDDVAEPKKHENCVQDKEIFGSANGNRTKHSGPGRSA